MENFKTHFEKQENSFNTSIYYLDLLTPFHKSLLLLLFTFPTALSAFY